MGNGKKTLILSISKQKYENQMTTNKERIAIERRSQISIFQSFNACRNSAQIEHYFIQSSSKSFKLLVIIILTIILFFIVGFLQIYPYFILENKAVQMTANMVTDRQEEALNRMLTTLNLSLMFTSFFSDLMQVQGFLGTDISDAPAIVKMFFRAQQSNVYNVWWGLGLESGGLVSFNKEVNTSSLMYCDTNYDEVYPLYYWPADPITGENPDYPYVNGIRGDFYDVRNRSWYRQALYYRRPLWSDLISGTSNGELTAIISAIAPVTEPETDQVLYVFSSGVSVDSINTVFRDYFPGEFTRAAILNSGSERGTVIAVTGNDNSYDEYQNEYTFKTLLELSDDIWRTVVTNRNFDERSNFSFTFNNTEMFCINAVIQISPNDEWTFYCTFSLNEYLDRNRDIVDAFTYTLFIIFVIVWVILEVSVFISSNLVLFRQSKILSKKDDKSTSHVNQSGVIPALASLKKLLLSHADNKDINDCVRNLVYELYHSGGSSYYEPKKIYNSIEHEKVKNKFIQLFGPSEMQLVGVTNIIQSEDSSYSGEENESIYLWSSDSGVENFSEISESSKEKIKLKPQINKKIDDEKSISKKSLDKLTINKYVDNKSSKKSLFSARKHNAALKNQKRLSSISIDPTLQNMINSRHERPIPSVKSMRKKILECIKEYNNSNSSFEPTNIQSPLFNQKYVNDIVEKLLDDLGENMLPFLYDSLNFIFIASKWRIQNLFCDNDYILAVIFTTFAWHLSMKDRIRHSENITKLYFQLSKKEFSNSAHAVLLPLYSKLTEETEEYYSRWEKFRNIVFKLVYSIKLWEHREAFYTMELIAPLVEMEAQYEIIGEFQTHSSRRIPLNISETFKVSQVLFYSSQMSFFFHKTDDIHTFQNIFLTGVINESQNSLRAFNNFIKCLIPQYIRPMFEAYNTLCGPEFVKFLTNTRDIA